MAQMEASTLERDWSQCLTLLEKELGTPTYETFFKSSHAISLEHNRLTVAVPSKSAKEWIERKFLQNVKTTVALCQEENLDLEFVVDESLQQKAPLPESPPEPSPALSRSLYTALNSKFSFLTFVVGNSNHFAQAAALAVAESPGKAYNPFFIYGGVGLGKTHLIHAIAHHVLSKSPHLKVVYVSAERFKNEVVMAIQENAISRFHKKYREIDLLLMDDIQFIVGKERTEEEFFHTFNELYGASKQIVISSDRPPKLIPSIEDRLRTRFEWGLIADVQAPDLETREAILRQKATIDQVHIPTDVISYIAERVSSNIRELEGTLNRVIAYCSLNKCPINLISTQDALLHILRDPFPAHISMPTILKTVADFSGVSVEELKAPKRDQRVVKPRQLAMYFCRELTGESYPSIGEEFGARDHTTVLYAYNKVRKLLNDPGFAASAKLVMDKIRENGYHWKNGG